MLFYNVKNKSVPVSKAAMHINMCECPQGLNSLGWKKKKYCSKTKKKKKKQDGRLMRILRIFILPE